MLSASHGVVHHLYGIDIRTPWPMTGVVDTARGRWDVEFVEGHEDMFAAAAASVPAVQTEWWAQHAALPDGSQYRRWTGLFEFLVAPDARRIHARTFDERHRESLLAYLFVDALSFAMIRLGREPLHATAVSAAGGAAAFVGSSGQGKSTLAALLLRADARLITDDMLVLTAADGGYAAEAGPPRIKLYRAMADRLLTVAYRGVPMNDATAKLIVPLPPALLVSAAQPIDVIYLLDAGHPAAAPPRPTVRALSAAAAVPHLLGATAAHYTSERIRMRNQFEFMTRLVQRVPVRTLSYRRDPAQMPALRDVVLEDLARTGGGR